VCFDLSVVLPHSPRGGRGGRSLAPAGRSVMADYRLVRRPAVRGPAGVRCVLWLALPTAGWRERRDQGKGRQ
jgi:hypothetical protein